MQYLEKIGKKAKRAFEDLKSIDQKRVKKVLDNYNTNLLKNKSRIIRENLKDVKNVKRKHLVDRLILDSKRIDNIRDAINEIAKFKNPIGKVLEEWERPNKLRIKKVTTPIGIIGVIYESRPNVTADVAALSLKSGNCCILRGGSDISGYLPTGAGSRTTYGSGSSTRRSDYPEGVNGHFLDSPSTTSAVTYSVRLKYGRTINDMSIFLNRSDGDDNSIGRQRSVSTVTAMEVSA